MARKNRNVRERHPRGEYREQYAAKTRREDF